MQLAYLLIQVVAIDVFNDYVDTVWSVDRVVESHDTVVVQAAQSQALFAQAINSARFLVQLRLIVLLNCDPAARLSVGCALHNTEGTLAKHAVDVVVLDRRLIETIQVDVWEVAA